MKFTTDPSSTDEQSERSAADAKAIHAQEVRAAARQKAEQIAAKLKEMKLADAAALLTAGIEETLYTTRFHANTGVVYEPTTRWNASCEKYDEEPELWAHFQMGNRR